MTSVYDQARRRRGVRRGRERGCWLYVPAEVLEKASVDPGKPPPFYRIWERKGRTLLVQFYAEP
jgi:hypothetical protein